MHQSLTVPTCERTEGLVGGPGFEPGASRSRTVLVACPGVSRRLPKGPPDLNCRLVVVLA